MDCHDAQGGCVSKAGEIENGFVSNPGDGIKQAPDEQLPKLLDYALCLIVLAVFGILGVLTRYLLEQFYYLWVDGLASDRAILYLDFPSNMIGSFMMGWLGVVFKADISNVSEYLILALSTGYLGSYTTFSGYNQKMVELTATGHWFFAMAAILIGLFLVAYSIIFGIETAKGFRWLLGRLKVNSGNGTCGFKINGFKIHLAIMVLLLLILAMLWCVSGVLMISEFKHGGNSASLWFACIIGPLGTWIRWFLARLNGRGLGRRGLLKWFPFGTLIVNISASCVGAALATTKKVVKNKNFDILLTGIQFGLLGNMSTTSTFAAEFNAMRESKQPWRAYAYAMVTICISFFLGILIYCVPIWRMKQ